MTAERRALDLAMAGVALAAVGFAWVALTSPAVARCGLGHTGSLWIGVSPAGLAGPGCLLRWRGVALYGGLALAAAGLLGAAASRRGRGV